MTEQGDNDKAGDNGSSGGGEGNNDGTRGQWQSTETVAEHGDSGRARGQWQSTETVAEHGDSGRARGQWQAQFDGLIGATFMFVSQIAMFSQRP